MVAKGRFPMREAWILMAASTGELSADADNLAIVMFFPYLMIKITMFGGIV